ncbi:MAG: imidazoleglycerol-phosphate dehydratase, partial [Candidatus Thiodiazotropha taylori]|nr:imidazoleglycerol-phosphate dehydratase [Candidatus Thiodiazotropha taylori]MCW4312092.1 imidazoleglycerol-phosphate dehydratase [Candidatus Thiodiazotropha taylori]
MQRTAQVERNTLETQISITLDLDGRGESDFATGVPF